MQASLLVSRCAFVWVACLTLGCGTASAAADAAAWNEVGKSDGVTVSTRAVDGSTYPEVLASGSVCASLQTLFVYIQDAAGFDRWIPDTLEARMLDRPSALEQIYYIRTGMPWPVKSRDMIYRLAAPDTVAGAHSMSVSIEGLPGYLPPDPDAVRMTSARGRWTFVEEAGRTHIDLVMHFEPGGNIPAWLATRRIVATPSKMLANLKAHFDVACVPASTSAGEQ
jgi:hypothetical protein